MFVLSGNWLAFQTFRNLKQWQFLGEAVCFPAMPQCLGGTFVFEGSGLGLKYQFINTRSQSRHFSHRHMVLLIADGMCEAAFKNKHVFHPLHQPSF